MFALLLLACALDSTEPATPGSPTAVQAEVAGSVADKSIRLAELAAKLTARMDKTRQLVAEGRRTPTEEQAEIQAMIAEMEALEVEIQAEVASIEAGISQL